LLYFVLLGKSYNYGQITWLWNWVPINT